MHPCASCLLRQQPDTIGIPGEPNGRVLGKAGVSPADIDGEETAAVGLGAVARHLAEKHHVAHAGAEEATLLAEANVLGTDQAADLGTSAALGLGAWIAPVRSDDRAAVLVERSLDEVREPEKASCEAGLGTVVDFVGCAD